MNVTAPTEFSGANTSVFSDFLNVTAQFFAQGQTNVASTFTVDPGVANTNIYSDHLNVTANTVFQGKVTFNDTSSFIANITTNGANTNIFGDHLNVTANTLLQGQVDITSTANVGDVFTIDQGVSNTNIFSDHLNITANTNHAGVLTLAGLNTTSTDVASAVNEVNDNAIAFSIALG